MSDGISEDRAGDTVNFCQNGGGGPDSFFPRRYPIFPPPRPPLRGRPCPLFISMRGRGEETLAHEKFTSSINKAGNWIEDPHIQPGPVFPAPCPGPGPIDRAPAPRSWEGARGRLSRCPTLPQEQDCLRSSSRPFPCR